MATQTLPVDITALFTELFKASVLLEVFQERFAESTTKGVDRINGFQFASRAREDLTVASNKCLSGSYRFTPYLENLKTKGRGKEPRLIAIPSIRDRIILHQLNKFLAAVFPDCIPRNIANAYVRTVATELATKTPETTFVCGCDIKSFYDMIQKERLLQIVARRLDFSLAAELIRHALLTPVVPRNTRRNRRHFFKSEKGVPQGLAISNILAAIYLHDVDIEMRKFGISYFRYVDDILMYGDEIAVRKAHRSLVVRLRWRGLALHALGSGKSHLGRLTSPFGYLGYFFNWPQVTVREATVERLLQSIAAKFSDHLHNKPRRLARFKYLTEERLAEIFLLELNERISGAISERRRYGWIAYFSQINDLSLLHKLDNTISHMFRRLVEFGKKAPSELKTFSRSYFEMKFNPSGGYIRDYDAISTRAEKLAFLEERGRIAPEEELTDLQISARVDSYRRRILSEMHRDEGDIYG
jgi:RNA-directed DNA polymerase